jgi:hypothetical protein
MIKKKIVFRIAIGLTLLLMPLSCMPVLFVFNMYNPMQTAFITDFKIENRSGEAIEITPIGTWGEKGDKSRLPLFKTAVPAVETFKTRHFYIKDNDTISFKYDWDDINFSEIAVRLKDGKYYQLVIDPTPTENQYHAPKTNIFRIPAISELSDIDPRVLEAVNKPENRTPSVLTVFSIVLPFLLWWLIIKYKRETKKAQQ